MLEARGLVRTLNDAVKRWLIRRELVRVQVNSTYSERANRHVVCLLTCDATPKEVKRQAILKTRQSLHVLRLRLNYNQTPTEARTKTPKFCFRLRTWFTPRTVNNTVS